ncbi:MAG: hypothetical protein BA865_12470 [Desulfobacterales bacterium S5133MH4]|nr:MAG: hypothetical protein BA865_12470 [Desulfobacterales bacterium S5133MH4]
MRLPRKNWFFIGVLSTIIALTMVSSVFCETPGIPPGYSDIEEAIYASQEAVYATIQEGTTLQLCMDCHADYMDPHHYWIPSPPEYPGDLSSPHNPNCPNLPDHVCTPCHWNYDEECNPGDVSAVPNACAGCHTLLSSHYGWALDLSSDCRAQIIPGECAGPPQTPDEDEDGICDDIDTEPDGFSDHFSDGTTAGYIINRNDQILIITDAIDPDGVSIRADTAGGTTPAKVKVCGVVTLSLDAGDEVVVTCGSVTIKVISGTADITLVGDDREATASLGVGNTLTFEPTTFAFTTPLANTDTVVILIDGDEIPLDPGSSTVLVANFDIDPDTLNLKSKGNWITWYIELPEGYDVNEIDISTVILSLGGAPPIAAALSPTEVGDYDNDTVPDLMVKFDRGAVQDVVSEGSVKMAVSGSLTDGTAFYGTDTVLVIDKGKEHTSEANHSSVVY